MRGLLFCMGADFKPENAFQAARIDHHVLYESSVVHAHEQVESEHSKTTTFSNIFLEQTNPWPAPDLRKDFTELHNVHCPEGGGAVA